MAVEKQRKKSKNRNKKVKLANNKLLGALQSTSIASGKTANFKQSGAERLQAVVQTLRATAGRVDLANNARVWIKMAAQVLGSADCSIPDAATAMSLVSYLVGRSSSNGSGGTSSSSYGYSGGSDAAVDGGVMSPDSLSSGKLQISSQLLLPVARLAVKRIAPHDVLHVPSLLMFRQLLLIQPGACLPIKDQLQLQLTRWFNTRPPHLLDCRLVVGSSNPQRGPSNLEGGSSSPDAAIAADVWALLPVATPAAGADSSSNNSSNISRRVRAVAAARGQQLQQLLLTLDEMLTAMLTNVLQPQGIERLSDKSPNVSPITFFRLNSKGNSSSADQLEESEDHLPSNPVERIGLQFRRCCNLLLFAERILESLDHSAGAALTLVPRDILLPVFRILQVSGVSLYQYQAAELRTLAQLWPALQHRALHLLQAALCTLQCNLSPCYHIILDQLTATMQALPTTKTAASLYNHNNTSKNNRNSTTNPNMKKPDGSGGDSSDKTSKSLLWFDAVAQQETVHLLLRSLVKLVKVSRNLHGTSKELIGTAMDHVTLHVIAAATLQKQSNRSISQMSIKKKSKRRGYSIVGGGTSVVVSSQHHSQKNTSSTNTSSSPSEARANNQAFSNLSVEKSFLIVSYSLEFLQSIVTFSPQLSLTMEGFGLLQQRLVRLVLCLSPEYLRSRGGSGSFCPSVSGFVDLSCFFTSPALLAKLFRLLSSVGACLHPSWPPPMSEILQLLQQEAHRHHHATEIVEECEAGIQRIRSLLCNLSIARHCQQVEDYRAAHGTDNFDTYRVDASDEEEDESEEEENGSSEENESEEEGNESEDKEMKSDVEVLNENGFDGSDSEVENGDSEVESDDDDVEAKEEDDSGEITSEASDNEEDATEENNFTESDRDEEDVRESDEEPKDETSETMDGSEPTEEEEDKIKEDTATADKRGNRKRKATDGNNKKQKSSKRPKKISKQTKEEDSEELSVEARLAELED